MKNSKRLIAFALILVLCLACVLVACNNGDKDNSTAPISTVSGKYYEYDGDTKDSDSWIELKSGGKWTDDDNTQGTFTESNGNIVFYVDDEELFRGTISNGVLTVDVFGMTAVYKKDGAVGDGGQQGSNQVDSKAKIKSITGGKVDGLNVLLDVASTVDDVDLSGMITTSKDSSWQLYADKLGQMLIPTKMCANLHDGENLYYLVVNSSDGTVNRLYTLSIFKNYHTNVYFYANDEYIGTKDVITHTYLEDYTHPHVEGYTFVSWNCEGWYVNEDNKIS